MSTIERQIETENDIAEQSISGVWIDGYVHGVHFGKEIVRKEFENHKALLVLRLNNALKMKRGREIRTEIESIIQELTDSVI